MKKVVNNVVYCPLLEQTLSTLKNHGLIHMLQAPTRNSCTYYVFNLYSRVTTSTR